MLVSRMTHIVRYVRYRTGKPEGLLSEGVSMPQVNGLQHKVAPGDKELRVKAE